MTDAPAEPKTTPVSQAAASKRAREWAASLHMLMGGINTARVNSVNLTLTRAGIDPLAPETPIWSKTQAECLSVCEPASKLYERLPKDVKARVEEMSAPAALIVAVAMFVKGSLDVELEIARQIGSLRRAQAVAGPGQPGQPGNARPANVPPQNGPQPGNGVGAGPFAAADQFSSA